MPTTRRRLLYAGLGTLASAACGELSDMSDLVALASMRGGAARAQRVIDTSYERELAAIIEHYAENGRLIGTVLSSSPTLDMGQSIPANDTLLTPPYRRSMIITEFRLRYDSVLTDNPTVAGPHTLSSPLQALSYAIRLRVGRVELTHGFVPCIALSQREQFTYGETTDLCVSGAFSGGAAMSPDNTNGTHYVWKLDVPLLIPAGASISAQVQRAASPLDDVAARYGLTTDAKPATVAVAGYWIKDPGFKALSRVKAPLAYGYTDPAAGDSVSYGAVQTTELNFKNTLGQPFEAWRMTGHLYARKFSATATSKRYGEYDGPEPTVRIGYSAGPEIVDPDRPFNSVFNFQTRALELHGMLMPNVAVLSVRVTKIASKDTVSFPSSGAEGVTFYPVLGLQGCREVSF